MAIRWRVALLVCVAIAISYLDRQSLPVAVKAVQADIPMTNTIRRAFAAGTRDSSGRPGRNYAQLRTDYTINARLEKTAATK